MNERVALWPGILAGPLDDLDAVRLAATRCSGCNEVSFGTNASCPNCGGSNVEGTALGPVGSLLTYSVIRHRPPGQYRGAEPFSPTGIALVGFPEGVAVVGLVEGAFETLEIGQSMRFSPHILYRNEAGEDVVSYRFAHDEVAA